MDFTGLDSGAVLQGMTAYDLPPGTRLFMLRNCDQLHIVASAGRRSWEYRFHTGYNHHVWQTWISDTLSYAIDHGDEISSAQANALILGVHDFALVVQEGL